MTASHQALATQQEAGHDLLDLACLLYICMCALQVVLTSPKLSTLFGRVGSARLPTLTWLLTFTSLKRITAVGRSTPTLGTDAAWLDTKVKGG